MTFKENTERLVTLAGFRHFGWNKSSVKMMVLNDENMDEASKFVSSKDWAGIHGMISSSPLPENPEHNISFEESSGFVPVQTKVKRSVLFFLHGKRMTSFRIIPYKSKRYDVGVSPDIGTLDPEGNRAAIIEITLRMPFTTDVDLEIPLVFWRGDRDDYMKMMEFGKYANFDVFVCPLRSQVECAIPPFIDPEKVVFNTMKQLGNGSTRAVYCGRYCGQDVACKVMLTNREEDREEERKQFMADIKTMTRIPAHPCIVQFLGAVAEPGNYCFITELCPFGSLLTAMKEHKDAWTNLMKVRAMYDCARAMNFLHQNGIVHRDLKLDHLLVVSLDPHSQVVCKLLGCESMKRLKAMERGMTMGETGVGTPYFMAPEVLIEATPFNETPDLMTPEDKIMYMNKADVYSFGITLAGTIKGDQPYDDDEEMSYVEFVHQVNRGMRPKVRNADSVPSDLITLMQECWDAIPERRPSFEVIVTKLREILSSFQK